MESSLENRGVIRNRKFAQQIRDFSGLRWGAITPTDIDAFLDFGNRCFIFVEAKFNGTPLGRGQELALERLCDACRIPGVRLSVLLIVAHYSQEDIDFAKLDVTKYRFMGKWIIPKTNIKLRDAIDGLRKRFQTGGTY